MHILIQIKGRIYQNLFFFLEREFFLSLMMANIQEIKIVIWTVFEKVYSNKIFQETSPGAPTQGGQGGGREKSPSYLSLYNTIQHYATLCTVHQSEAHWPGGVP